MHVNEVVEKVSIKITEKKNILNKLKELHDTAESNRKVNYVRKKKKNMLFLQKLLRPTSKSKAVLLQG